MGQLFLSPLRLLLAAIVPIFGTGGGAGASEAKPYVIELFTSQGCSSCPPADALLSKIAHFPKAVALSLHVDYWDYMGWKDTLASPDFTARQKHYAAARGDGHVYTPQAVVDGLIHVVGSKWTDIDSAANAAFGASGALTVPLTLSKADGKLLVEVGQSNAAAKSGSLWLVRLAKETTVAIGRGENKGRTLTYTNVVRSMTPFGDWNGAPGKFPVPPPNLGADADSFVVLLQAGSAARPGAILAVAKSDDL